MSNWLFYTVPAIFIPIYCRNLFTNTMIFLFTTVIFFGVIPGAFSFVILYLLTDISFYAAMKRIDDDHS